MINVMAKDIANLPEAHKKFWVAHNVAPDGQVSQELLTMQAEGNWVHTIASEIILWKEMEALQIAFQRRYSRDLFRPSATFDNVVCHRFICSDLDGLSLLSKKITRSTIEFFDQKALKDLTPDEDSKLGTLKRLEKLINIEGLDGHAIEVEPEIRTGG